jgi:hypothetical protein
MQPPQSNSDQQLGMCEVYRIFWFPRHNWRQQRATSVKLLTSLIF